MPNKTALPSSRAIRLACVAIALFASATQAQTVSTGGAEVRGFHARSATKVFAATHGGGLYQSTDGLGNTWSRITLPNGVRYLTSIAGNTAAYMVLAGEEGLLRTSDATVASPTFTRILFEPVAAVAVGPNTSTTVLAAVKGVGIMMSTNSGASFTLANNSAFDSLDLTAVAFDPSNANVAYAAASPDRTGARGGVFRSADGGATWVNFNADIPMRHITSLVVDSAGRVYAGGLDPGNQGDVYYRASGAGSWTASTNFFGGVVSLHRDNNAPVTIWGGGRTLGLQSGSQSGFGYAFTQAGTPNPLYTGINAVVTLPGTTRVLKAIRGAGVWSSTVGSGTWTRLTGFTGADRVLSATNIGSPSTTSLLAGLLAGGVWRSTNSGASWTPPTVNAGQADFSFAATFTAVNPWASIWELAGSPTNANLAYAAAGGVGMFYSNDSPGIFRWNGTAWQGIGNAPASGAPWNIASEPGLTLPSAQAYGVAINRGDDTVPYASFLGASHGVMRRLGGTWSSIAIPAVTPQVRTVVTSSNPAKLLALPFDDKAVISTDFGASYGPIQVSQTGFERLRFFSAAENPANPNQWIAGTNKGLFISSNGGVNWTRVPMEPLFQQLAISAVGYMPSGHAFVADFDGNRYCSTNGATWISAGSKLLSGVNAIRTIAGNLYYLTDGAGMFREDGTC